MSSEPLSGTEDRARPKPCKRYAKMLLSPKFLAHLPACRACKRVLTNLHRESELHRQDARFRTCLLPHNYSSFGQNSKVTGKPC
jgi:hypothetical protein